MHGQAEELNSEFRVPLPPREVRGLAKSVASWTWERYAGSGKQYNRGAAMRAGLINGTEPVPVRIVLEVCTLVSCSVPGQKLW